MNLSESLPFKFLFGNVDPHLLLNLSTTLLLSGRSAAAAARAGDRDGIKLPGPVALARVESHHQFRTIT